jgi:hypothetical protein
MRFTRRQCLAALGLRRPAHARLHLRRAAHPITTPVTKLGGSPVWVEQPAWPRSNSSGEKMLFIGQVVIEPVLFNTPPGRIAYIFINDSPKVDNTWDPHSGENAVVIQQARPNRQPVISTGPRLQETIFRHGRPGHEDIELEGTLEFRDTPEKLDLPTVRLSERERVALGLRHAVQRQQIGGTPDWIQHGAGVPPGFRLLLQLDNYPIADGRMLVPNYNFGTGTGYVMINPSATRGVLLWECD